MTVGYELLSISHLFMRLHFALPKPFFLIVPVAIVLAGCSQAGKITAIVTAPTAAPKATRFPTPLPTPDPIAIFKEQQKIAPWAQGKVLHDVRIEPGKKVIALTFDDGPWPHSTHRILEILANYNAKATFYMVGEMAHERPELAREVRDAGHAIGNHSWTHPSRPRDPIGEVKRTNAAIKKAVGFEPTTFRPPYGIVKNGMAKEAMKEKMAVLIWSDDSDDWRRPPASRIAATVLREATPGGVVLMHDGGGDRSKTVAALPIILSKLSERGYGFVTIPQLIAMRYVPPPVKKPAKKSVKKPAANKKKKP